MKAYNKKVIEAAVKLAEIFDVDTDLSIQDHDLLIEKRYAAIEDLKRAVYGMQYNIENPDLIQLQLNAIKTLRQIATNRQSRRK